MLLGLAAAVGAATMFGTAAVVQAVAVRRSGLVSGLMGLVVLGYLFGWGLHVVAIARLPLYLAQMAVGGSLAVTALIASRVVREPLERRHWVAIGAMVFGFALLVGAAGPVGTDDDQPHLTAALYAVWAVLAVCGLFAWRWRQPRSGVLLGVLAGLSYSGAPIATRALVDARIDVDTLVPGLTIALFGSLGFVLQSLALERVTVTAAIAPMVLLETFVPALLGVLLFHDEVKHGLGALALVGFVIATVGTLVISNAEGALEQIEEVPPAPDEQLPHERAPDERAPDGQTPEEVAPA